jgi:molecular chaperone DnaJ
MDDIFSSFFSGGASGRRSKKPRGRDISVDLELTFSEAVFGVDKKVLITKVSFCDDCGGSGATKGTKKDKCDKCAGKGFITETRSSFFGSFSSQRECDKCHGTGEIPKEPCKTCGGRGVLRKTEEIPVSIPAGIDDGAILQMTGLGEAVFQGRPGDLYIKIHVKDHSVFKREGHNITMELNIKLSDALLGAEYEISTLDGKIKLKIPAGISFGEILRVAGRGVPASGSKRGDLMVKISIQTPGRLSKKAVELIEKLREEGI